MVQNSVIWKHDRIDDAISRHHSNFNQKPHSTLWGHNQWLWRTSPRLQANSSRKVVFVRSDHHKHVLDSTVFLWTCEYFYLRCGHWHILTSCGKRQSVTSVQLLVAEKSTRHFSMVKILYCEKHDEIQDSFLSTTSTIAQFLTQLCRDTIKDYENIFTSPGKALTKSCVRPNWVSQFFGSRYLSVAARWDFTKDVSCDGTCSCIMSFILDSMSSR